MPVPTLAELKLPASIKPTLSPDRTPIKDPPVTNAVVSPSYILLATVVPDTVNAIAVMLALSPVGCVSV